MSLTCSVKTLIFRQEANRVNGLFDSNHFNNNLHEQDLI